MAQRVFLLAASVVISIATCTFKEFIVNFPTAGVLHSTNLPLVGMQRYQVDILPKTFPTLWKSWHFQGATATAIGSPMATYTVEVHHRIFWWRSWPPSLRKKQRSENLMNQSPRFVHMMAPVWADIYSRRISRYVPSIGTFPTIWAIVAHNFALFTCHSMENAALLPQARKTKRSSISRRLERDNRTTTRPIKHTVATQNPHQDTSYE